jgi:hypothetical protein
VATSDPCQELADDRQAYAKRRPPNVTLTLVRCRGSGVLTAKARPGTDKLPRNSMRSTLPFQRMWRAERRPPCPATDAETKRFALFGAPSPRFRGREFHRNPGVSARLGGAAARPSLAKIRSYLKGRGGSEMAFYLVSAVPKHGRLDELGARRERDEFMSMRSFGRALSTSLRGADSPRWRRRLGGGGLLPSRHSPSNGPRGSTTIFTTCESNRWPRARAGLGSKTCPSCSLMPEHIDPT